MKTCLPERRNPRLAKAEGSDGRTRRDSASGVGKNDTTIIFKPSTPVAHISGLFLARSKQTCPAFMPHSPVALKVVEENRQTTTESERHYRAVDTMLSGMMLSAFNCINDALPDVATAPLGMTGKRIKALNWALGSFYQN